MFVAFAMTAFAQNPIASLEDIKPGKIFWLQFSPWLEGNGVQASLFWPGEGQYEDRLWSTLVFEAVEDNPEDPRQQFTVVEYEGKLYLYNIAAQKFVAGSNGSAMMMDIPTSYVEAFESTYGHASYPWILAFDGTGAITSIPANGFEEYGFAYCGWSLTDAAPYASCQIYEVGDFADVAALTETLAHNMTVGKQQREEALKALKEAAYDAQEFLAEVALYSSEGGGQITLQVADEDAGNYIWCNEPESSEGSIEYLVDGQLTNASFFHSRWQGRAEPQHWLQVDLSEPIQNFSFAYHTRIFDGGNDFPDAIEVMGSNDGKNFTSIANFEDKLPQMANTRWESGTIEAAEKYSHLRFVVTAERIYFHMSEFYLYAAAEITAKEEYLPYKEKLQELDAMFYQAMEMLEDEFAKTADITALTEQIIELHNLIVNLVSDVDDPLTLEYVDEVKELLALEGVGYPAEAPRATLKTLVDAAVEKPTAKARLALEEAVGDYISTEDITMPVDGVRYSLTFVTYGGRSFFLKYQDNLLSMEMDTLTAQGLPLPETAAFTCEDNNDGTYSFRTADGRYLKTPDSNAPGSGTESGASDYKTSFTIVKMYPNGKCESNVTYERLFGLIALSNGGTYMAPNSNATTFYTGTLPHFMSSWTSAMSVVEFEGDDETGIKDLKTENGDVEGIYDLQGRRVENPTKGIYVVNGKKILVK